jgi:beta-galactosidase
MPILDRLHPIGLLLILALTTIGLQAHAQQDSTYVFVYAKQMGGQKASLGLCTSTDGYRWAESKVLPQFVSTLGDSAVHDPSVVRDSAGIYHMVYGIGPLAKGIGYATSRDLKVWSAPTYIGIMDTVAGAQAVTTPDLYYDRARRRFQIVFSASVFGRYVETENLTPVGANFRAYSAVTPDFRSFRPANVISDLGFPLIDGTIMKLGKYFYLFGVNAATLPSSDYNITLSTSVFPTGPYGQASDPIHGAYQAKSPTLARIGKEWFIYLERPLTKQMGMLKSTDLQNWADFSSQITFPAVLGQGSVVRVATNAL